ncbi:hypothetical protein ANCCAN_12832 [Ancylostoma caninum]|uniref:Uncharacterized protein n=1 Tax=Ancylostoma caninum TaxID=29170 RepID=A0A368GDY6_ANCCA|nr:hypothetical protein ANCCAN_12832 [Ancylostoma caninum]
MQARKIRCDVTGLIETRRHRPLKATFDTGEELFLGTCDSRRVGEVGVLVNTNLDMNIDLFEQLTTRIGRATKRRLSYETLELIPQRGAARAAGNYQLTYEIAGGAEKR